MQQETELPEFTPDELEPDVDQQQPHEVDHQEPEQQDERPPAPAPQFNYNDRLYALGFSRSGKSEILNLLFSGIACQKVMLDTKPEFAIDDVEPVSSPDAIDWREPIIHYKPAPGSDSTQYEAIFEHALTYGGALTVCVHELQDLVDYRPQRAGRFLLGYAAKGGALGKGFLVGTQRPRLAPVSALTEANHIIVLPPRLAREEDMVTAAEQLSPVDGQPISGRELANELAALEQQHGAYSFLWKHRMDASGALLAFPPLPDELRARSIVRRLEDA